MNTILAVDKLTKPMFSLALSRDLSNTGFGGYFAIGGIPDLSKPAINARNSFITVPFSPDSYYITIDGIAYSSPTTPSVSDTTHRDYLVDSGTAFIIAPSADAAAIAQLFNPPASPYFGLYRVDCAATAPQVQFIIGGASFIINPKDMIFYNERDGSCVSAIAPGDSNYVLGAPFLRNVVAVFDWGKAALL